jgi:hypothetical protein
MKFPSFSTKTPVWRLMALFRLVSYLTCRSFISYHASSSMQEESSVSMENRKRSGHKGILVLKIIFQVKGKRPAGHETHQHVPVRLVEKVFDLQFQGEGPRRLLEALAQG